MIKDITIGQYFPGNSPIHRINPAVKIILTIAYIAILFFITNPIAYLIFGVYTITLIMLSGVPFRYILEGLKPLVWIVFLTSVLNIFMTNGTTIAEIQIFFENHKRRNCNGGQGNAQTCISDDRLIAAYAYDRTFTADRRHRKTA